MPKPVCVPCGRFFRPLHNGRAWIENKPICEDAPPGNAAPEKWTFYKAWRSDEWQCHGCGARIIVGHSHEPFAQDFQPGAKELAAACNANEIVVNDC